VVKLLAFGPVGYFLDAWNVFDCLVTLLTTASLFLRSLKLVVVLRVIRLAKLITLARASSLKQVRGPLEIHHTLSSAVIRALCVPIPTCRAAL
jgi:hypothetical protein